MTVWPCCRRFVDCPLNQRILPWIFCVLSETRVSEKSLVFRCWENPGIFLISHFQVSTCIFTLLSLETFLTQKEAKQQFLLEAILYQWEKLESIVEFVSSSQHFSTLLQSFNKCSTQIRKSLESLERSMNWTWLDVIDRISDFKDRLCVDGICVIINNFSEQWISTHRLAYLRLTVSSSVSPTTTTRRKLGSFSVVSAKERGVTTLPGTPKSSTSALTGPKSSRALLECKSRSSHTTQQDQLFPSSLGWFALSLRFSSMTRSLVSRFTSQMAPTHRYERTSKHLRGRSGRDKECWLIGLSQSGTIRW